ncbi:MULTISPECIES: ABC transporter ATP-binding protein/permease [Clostridium]|uniref:ABC transporter ATP-binding protein/permease n=1 Tax=Clostridium TaxID=1485 RepID=UPI00189DE28D|nr:MULTISPECIES: ABC transporter ATP-binding protein/permease [Clostridium]MBS7131130.1 ABC transporter ATP-binding protein/permease [Clostridium sp.]MDB2093757.1 ABC transporter ATP-binding protein/permease [Clostridium paraputrificum]MDB2100521.1 ABC transporter ATP-binding protein/permease [Clostridium paraputrificum]MDB2117757.1 ABC transporter ATP-binding protein/permease [Clostridium paraputrificum]MDU1033744.1 ABC transporter ATP-binding protein/permease [Clostridium sp.]
MMINKRLINYCEESKKYIVLTVLANWISLLCNIGIILIVGDFIGKLFTGDSLGNNTLRLIILGMLILIRIAANLSYGHFSHKASEGVKVKLRDGIFGKLTRIGLNYNKVTSTSSVVQVAVEGVEQLEVYFGRYLPQFFYALLAPITLFILFSFISLKAAIVFLVCVPLIPVSIIAIMKIAKRILKDYWNNYANLGDTFLENLQGLTTLKVFNIDEERHKKMNDEAENFRRITMKVLSMQLNSINVMDLVAFGGAALGSIITLNAFYNGQVTLAGTIIIILLSSEFFIPLRLLGSFFHIAMNGMAACDRIFKLLDSDELEERKEDFTKELSHKADIEVDNITFSYDGERNVINNVSMKFEKDKFTAIVGESGSGKSTIASLLLNTFKVNEGNIKVNGIDINRIPLKDLYEKMVIISTNSFIFNGSIKDNLLIGKRDATVEEINRALEVANLKEFVYSLDDGLDTQVGEGGSLLSGGQKQRLAFARAILSDREILILDEATSNIDVESEEMIWNSVEKLRNNKTLIVISHRLANVKNADKIYLLDKGNLVEEGNHEELMNKKNKYFNLVSMQEELEGKGVM